MMLEKHKTTAILTEEQKPLQPVEMLAWAGTATIKKDGLTSVLVIITIAETQMAIQPFGALPQIAGNTARQMLLSSVMLTTIGQSLRNKAGS
jgi:hypothetical protein